VVHDVTPALGFEPAVRFSGVLEGTLAQGVADDLLAVLREALSNVARHAHASQAEVDISADPDWPDPRAEGAKIISDLPAGLGTLEVINGAGHYPHTETPAEVLALLVPFLRTTLLASSGGA
jgi:pimeloyl-ACP methyl ester carboxylesterase